MSVTGTREQVLRRVYGLFAAGDYAALEPELHPRVEYVNPDDAVEPGTRSGISAFVAALRRLHEMFDYEGAEIRELIESGDETVAIVRFVARGKGSAVPMEAEFAHLITWEDQKIRRLEWFKDRASAVSALG